MRVVHVITRLILGGAQENTLHTVEDLAERHGDQVTLIAGPAEGPEGDLYERAARHGVDLRIVPNLIRAVRPAVDFRAYRELRVLFDDLRPDVVHTHSSKAGILGRAAAAKCRVPVVVHTIHGLPFHLSERWWKNRFYVAAERWAALCCQRIISVADAMTDQAVAAGVAPRAKFLTIHSGMEVEPFLHPPRPRDEVRREFGFTSADVVVGKVARLFEHKGHDDVLGAAVGLVARRPNVRFLFVGGGVWRDRLEANVKRLGLAEHVRFTGLVAPNRIPELLHAMDIVVHASLREGLARVLPQALLWERPIVSYDIDGAREVVLPGKTGVLVPPRDLAALRAGLECLIADPALRERFGRAGRELFTDQFRHERMTERIRAVYEEELAKRR